MTFNLKDFRSLPIRSEAEIMASWNGTEPVVSVICMTYNQKIYIEDAIRGFLLQETRFPFEILIHDDASTDGTQELVQSYIDKYSKIIKPIFQKQNKYSESPNSVIFFATDQAVGEYLAICEGDDFWVNKNKLQAQVDFFIINPNYSICFHKAYSGSTDGNLNLFHLPWKTRVFYPLYPSSIPIDEVIIGDGGYISTASIMLKKNAFANLPKWFVNCPVGDYFLQVLCSHPDGALFLPQAMSFYRVSAIGSWSSSINAIEDKKIHHQREMVKYLQEMNSHLEGKYCSSINQMKLNSILYLFADSKLSLNAKKKIFDIYLKNNLPTIFNKVVTVLSEKYPAYLQYMLYTFRWLATINRVLFYSRRHLLKNIFTTMKSKKFQYK